MNMQQRVMLTLALLVASPLLVVMGLMLEWKALGLVSGSALPIVAGIYLYLTGARTTVMVLAELSGAVRRMAGGDLRENVRVEGNDTARAHLGAVQDLQLTLRTMMGTLSDGADQVNTAASEIAAGKTSTCPSGPSKAAPTCSPPPARCAR